MDKVNIEQKPSSFPMNQAKWFERNFDFNVTADIFPSILERLEGTPVRLEEKCKGIPPNLMSVRINDTWTIKENIGHLADLEPLWQGRLEDIIKGNEELRTADLQNKKTESANHNGKPLNELMSTFRQLRSQTLIMLGNIDETAFLKSSLHPRLKKAMRIPDLFLFVAEHDDHHLARITQLVKIIKEQ